MTTTTEVRAKSLKIENPAHRFIDWEFQIDQHHYESLGLTYRQFIKDKKPYFKWAAMEPPEYSFQVGYVFYGAKDNKKFLQVASDWDAFRIEVHAGLVGSEKSRNAYAVTSGELADWLRTGEIPSSAVAVDMPASKSGILAWELSRSAPTLEAPV